MLLLIRKCYLLQGPTISPVYNSTDRVVKVDYYAIVVCVQKSQLYEAVKQLRKVHSVSHLPVFLTEFRTGGHLNNST